MFDIGQPHRADAINTRFTQNFSRFVLRLIGWKIDEWAVPEGTRKMVIAGAYHTANFDGIIMILACNAMGVRLNWLGKVSLFKGIIGYPTRWTGGIMVDRDMPTGVVGQVAAEFRQRDYMMLVLAPESTREKTDYWRTGFYYMALEADVPVGLGHIDYKRKACGIGQIMMPTGDLSADEAILQDYYAQRQPTARYPDQVGPVKFRPREDEEKKAS